MCDCKPGIIFLVVDVDTIQKALVRKVDIDRNDRDIQFIDDLRWEVTGAIGNNLDGHISISFSLNIQMPLRSGYGDPASALQVPKKHCSKAWLQ